MNPNRLLGQVSVGAISFLLLLLPTFISAQLNVAMSGTSPTCDGWTNGQVTATIQNGVGPFSTVWSNGAMNTNVLQNLGAGTYGVTVTDANNQTANGSFTLNNPASLVVNPTATGGCAGGGGANANASGGTGGLSYLWDTGATTANVSGLNNGLHCVTVTDAVGCQKVGCLSIVGPLQINMVVQGLACFNFCDASVEAVVTGGTPPYSYAWSNGFNGGVNPNLGPGTYSVLVTDAAGCTINGSATVGNPVQLNINVNVVNPACGAGGTGSASASASGGTAPYLFTWSTGAVGANISGLAPGTYGLTVTDFLGCQGVTSVTVVPSSNIQLNVTANPSSACGVSNGSASVSIVGGTAPFTILWSNNATTANINNLAPNTYTVMVTDVNGCGATASVTVGGTPAINLNITGVNGGCAANGSANAMVTPGTGTAPFTFLWSNNATTAIINNLTAGTYSVTVTDAAGCTDTDQVNVTGAANISVSTSVTNVNCFAGNNGSATATVTGATGQVFYMWSNNGSTQTISNLSTGTYFVTVMDNASGCTATTNAFVSQPTAVVANATGEDGACNELGAASATATGGNAPYTFLWSNMGNMPDITGLVAGTYTVTATDSHGCTDAASVTVAGGGSLGVDVVILSQVSGSGTMDGSVTANVTGGQAPFDYLWNTNAGTQTISGLSGGNYCVTVTDVFGCTGSDCVFLEELGCIGDKVWNDNDHDGCQDGGELGVADIVITLTGTTTSGNTVNLTTETANNGFYSFDNLAAGNYVVHFNLPLGFVFSPLNGCTNDFTDSDVPANGNVSVTLAMGQCNVTVDAGIYDACVNISTAGEICCDQILCGPGNNPAPITSVVNASGGGSPVQYLWMFSTTGGTFNTNTWYPVGGATSASYDPGPVQQTTHYIRCAKAANCDDWLESNPVTIFVDDVAVAEIFGNESPCVDEDELYHAGFGGNGATYAWDFGFYATPQTANTQDVTVSWSQSGVFTITLTVTNDGCTSYDELEIFVSDSPVFCGTAFGVNVNNQANAVMVGWQMEQVPGNYNFVVQRSANGVDFTDLATMPQSATAGMIDYAFADYFPKRGNAFYRVQLRDGNQHMLFSDAELVQRFDQSRNFVSYPNPASDVFFIEANDEVTTAVQAEILTLSGSVVSTETIAEGTAQHALQTSNLRAGTYFLRLTYNNGEREVVRMVKK